MTETLFYHLEGRTLEDILPGLWRKSRQRGWKALIRADTRRPCRRHRYAALDL